MARRRTKEPKVRANFTLEPGALKALQFLSDETGITMSSIVESSLHSYIRARLHRPLLGLDPAEYTLAEHAAVMLFGAPETWAAQIEKTRLWLESRGLPLEWATMDPAEIGRTLPPAG